MTFGCKDGSKNRHEFTYSCVPVETKAVSETGEFEGYAAIFNEIDRGRDIILPGAFNKSLGERPAGSVKMLHQHNPSEPLGVFTEIREDSRGLYCKGRLILDVPRVRDLYTFMKNGAIEGLSIGYESKGRRFVEERNVRELYELDLWEISVVTFPMQILAGVTGMKNRGDVPTPREMERSLERDVGLSHRQAKRFMACGYDGLRNSERDVGAETESVSELLADMHGCFAPK